MRARSRPTIIDVARLAGVSSATVSYVLSGPPQRAARISEETTSRILDVVKEIGYVPNQSARSLRLRRANRVVFLGSRLSSLYSQAMATSIEQGLLGFGLAFSVQIGSSLEHIQRAIMTLDQGQADGLIVETTDKYFGVLRAAAANGHAIVAIGPTRSEAALDVMSIDDGPAVGDAMQHVVACGYRHFLLLSSLPDVLDEPRIAMAFQWLQAHGIDETAMTILHCPHDRILAHDLALRILSDFPRPLAVYPGSDVSAIGILWACYRAGLRVPEDVGIIGHGNTSETQVTVPRLTSLGPVSSDFSKAAELIASRLRNRDLEGRQIVVPCQLSIRGSTRESGSGP